MGARNVGAAYLMWSHLPDGPFRVLVGMALRSLDEDGAQSEARRWYGGEDDLIGFVRQTDAAGKLRTRATRRASAYRYLEQLRDAGAITVVTPGARGRRAVYAVHVDPMSLTPSDPPVSDPVRRDVSDPVRRDVSDPVRPLGTTEEPPRKNGEENLSRLHHLTSREGRAVDHGMEIALMVETTTAEQYQAASAHLARTIGAGPAGDQTASYLIEHPDAGYQAAVIHVALQNGWSS